MELDAVRIDQRGRAIKDAEMQLEPVAITAGGEEMVLDNVAVPGGQSGQGEASAPASQQAPVLTVTPPRIEAYRIGALRVVVFAAGSNAGAPAYDGIAIELP
jgi:hypothetical protein